MTRVDFSEENGRYILKAAGHSGYSDNGSDIVCSAVSALVCTLANALCSQKGERFISLEPGNTLIIARGGDNEADEEISRMFSYTLLGLRLVAKKYPLNLRVNIH